MQGARTTLRVAWPPAPPRAQLHASQQHDHAQQPIPHGGVSAPSYVLYRIIGNDLIPRHAKGQSRQNLAFILANEPRLSGCEKRFIVNRIVDPAEEQAILALLEDAGMPYLRIPFEPAIYRQCDWAEVPHAFRPHSPRYRRLLPAEKMRVDLALYAEKNRYAMNNNGARNVALEDGKTRADYVLPWDGNCFVTARAWQEITHDISQRPGCPYFITPMARVLENHRLNANEFRPTAQEEPQIIFRHDAIERFNEAYVYGRRPKVELLWRLGVPGPWQHWPIEPWDESPRPLSPQGGEWAYAGWVARLFSGHKAQETVGNGAQARLEARQHAIKAFLDLLDEQQHAR
ncbi:hypothetical protein GLV89_13625 [Halomonas alkaliantarctica]|nr:hypothetical protein [Halomonas alkaliantarctica]